MLKATITGIGQIQRAIEADRKSTEKAMQTAVKVESFRLRGALKKEIRAGAPGGQKFEPLTFLARKKRGSKRFSPNKPLARLALPIAYHIKSFNPFTLAIGWTGPRVSKSWKAIAEKQQEGFTKSVTDPQESYFRHRGEEVAPKSAFRKIFFLRESTNRFKTPAREILDPFWKDHQIEAWKNIRNNFQRKMRGERI